MASDSTLPSAPAVEVGPNIVLQPPLSRCGHGPGLLLIRPSTYADCQRDNSSLDPEPLQKWAEESFAVAQITLNTQSCASLPSLVRNASKALASLEECNVRDKFGLLGMSVNIIRWMSLTIDLVYGSQADYAPEFRTQLRDAVAGGKLAAAVYFDTWAIPDLPGLYHTSASVSADGIPSSSATYSYPDASSPGFIVPGHADFDIAAGGVAHTRSLTFLKKHLGGPYFDLEKIWDEHTYFEFGDRSVEKTMATMVQEPYVNHVPTLTGGIGRARLSRFYLNHFIFNNPDDTKLELISRTVGVDRVVDEFIFSFTHNKMVDWLIPGIPPTNKPLRIPFTSVVNIRGDRLYHEHIAWDQATVLVQLNLLPEYLPFPYALPDGRVPAAGKRFEYRVPAAGVETALKLQNEHLVPSNEMIEFKVREVEDK
ncbi:hypothetical protein BJX61DRAFT_240670 [Aspergillus egyptiacus]|nr:hypothetical protein BJX61DRAFT_240670 [Aspergillus egyptiacus]